MPDKGLFALVAVLGFAAILLLKVRGIDTDLVAGGAVVLMVVYGFNGVHELVARLQNLQKTEQELSKLKAANADLAKQSVLLKSLGLGSDDKLRNVASAVKRASEIDPNDPPALLKRALDVIDRLGASTQPGQVKPLSEMVAGPELEQRLATLETERDQLRRERNNLMRGPGNGLTYPSCWTTAAGQTEYIFDVTFADTGLQVRNASPAKANDKAWDLVGQFARETMIDEKIFISATKKLFEWSKGQNCRFQSSMMPPATTRPATSTYRKWCKEISIRSIRRRNEERVKESRRQLALPTRSPRRQAPYYSRSIEFGWSDADPII
jgi:cell division protein FtsB